MVIDNMEFNKKRLIKRIEEDVMDLFYDYEDKYEEALDNAIKIYTNDIENKDTGVPDRIIDNLIIAILDISNQLENVEVTQKFLKIAEQKITSSLRKYRVELGKAQLLAIKGEYAESIELYNSLEDHYSTVDDECMLATIEYHRGLYFSKAECYINALRIYIDMYDDSKRAKERVEDTYNKIINMTLSISELTTVNKMKNEILCLGIAI